MVLLSVSAAVISLNIVGQDNSTVTNDGSNPTITAGVPKVNETESEIITLNPVDDAYITQTTSDNYGSASDLMVKMAFKEEHGATRITYLKFDLGSENLDSADISSASLRLHCTVNNVTAPTLNVHGVADDTWTESGINGTNEPLRGDVLSSTPITAEGQYYEWDVSSFVASEADGDDIVSLVVFKTGNEGNINFASKEASANWPELVINGGGVIEPNDHAITATAGSNGTITPVGIVALVEGSDQTFDIIPDLGYIIEDVLVDSVSVGAVGAYTFSGVTADHTISASFVHSGQSYNIAASAGLNGSITPNGSIVVPEGADQVFTITADDSYTVTDVLVDGASIGVINSYTFTGVTANHTISASFGEQGDSITSRLWGVNGENWDPDGPLKDFTHAGYMSGDEPIPHWPICVYVTDFGAVGDGVNDDTQAFIQALDSCPKGSAVFVPLGRYVITEQINFNRDSVVLRGEDMYATVLYFPFGLQEIDSTIDASRLPYQHGLLDVNGNGSTSSHRSMENFTIEFREEQNLGHWSQVGTNGIDLSGVSDCWIRNICIKNANNGITLYASNITILDIVFDNFDGRVGSESEGYAGHQGIKINSYNNLIHNVQFQGDDYEHTISFNNGGRNNVISLVSSPDMQLDDHGGNTGYNLFTEIDLGEGTPEVGRQTYRGSHDYSTFWNINAVKDQPYKEIFNENKEIYQGADIRYINTVVGLKTSLPTATTAEYWHEKIDPTLLQPQNIYIAQLLKNEKDLPASFDNRNNPGRFTIKISAGSNGSITPGDSVSLLEGWDQAFTIVADSGYTIADVQVDGTSLGAVGSYTFNGVTSDHTISASFEQVMHTITVNAGSNGTITPGGNVTVANGSDQTFDISADDGYEIADVQVDGVSVGAVASYTFRGVEADHTISASFIQDTTATSAPDPASGAQASSSIIIFPNPTNGTMHICGIDVKARVRIFDLSGNERIYAEAGSNTTLDVSDLKAGVYIIEVLENDKRVLHRLVKQ